MSVVMTVRVAAAVVVAMIVFVFVIVLFDFDVAGHHEDAAVYAHHVDRGTM